MAEPDAGWHVRRDLHVLAAAHVGMIAALVLGATIIPTTITSVGIGFEGAAVVFLADGFGDLLGLLGIALAGMGLGALAWARVVQGRRPWIRSGWGPVVTEHPALRAVFWIAVVAGMLSGPAATRILEAWTGLDRVYVVGTLPVAVAMTLVVQVAVIGIVDFGLRPVVRTMLHQWNPGQPTAWIRPSGSAAARP